MFPSTSYQRPILTNLPECKEAIRLEEYGKAADLRDRILALENTDPVLKLEAQLKAAIESQLFEVRCMPSFRPYSSHVGPQCRAKLVNLAWGACIDKYTFMLHTAVQEAARCRDELLKLRPERKLGPPLTPPPPTLSDTLTNGVRVQVKRCGLHAYTSHALSSKIS